MVRAALRATGCCIVPLIGASVEQMDAREQGDREQPPNEEAALTARFRRLGEQRAHPEAVSQQSQGEPPAADATAITIKYPRRHRGRRDTDFRKDTLRTLRLCG